MMTLLRKEEGYSYYENPDSELVEKIKNLPKPEYFEIGWGDHSEYTFVKEQPNGKYLVENREGDVKTVEPNEYNESLHEAHLENINRTFLISNTFNKYFAPFKNGQSIIFNMTDKYLVNPFRTESFYSGVSSVFNSKRWDAYNSETKYYNGTKVLHYRFICEGDNGNGHIYFTENGEIANRDYNMDLNDPKPFISLESTKEEFLTFLNKVPDNFEYLNNKWYTDDYVFFIYKDEEWDRGFEIEAWPKQTSGYFPQGESYRKIIKPKKGCEAVTKEHFLNAVKEFLTKYSNKNE